MSAVADGFLKKSNDDSPLKTVFQWGGGLLVAYFGGRYLIGKIGQDVEANQQAKAQAKAAGSPNSPEAIAQIIWNAIGGSVGVWDIFKPVTDIDNDEIYRVFGLGKGATKNTGLIQTKSWYAAVVAAYKRYTGGRLLEVDLNKNLSSNDWKAVQARIRQINCLDYVNGKDKTGKATKTLKKICQ